jgi:2-isopropylmalate synthase
MSPDIIYFYDTTLRDGAQTQGVDFSVRDKRAIARELENLGIDYIEGGWPGSNPTDDDFFSSPPPLKTARLTAFGMTRRAGQSAGNDAGLQHLLRTPTTTVCLVGKAWDFQVDVALGIDRSENLAMITDSIAEGVRHGKEMVFDAEHFFDGWKANPEYALAALYAAHKAGARWLTLCDTNGGTLPHEIDSIVRAVTQHLPGHFLGIHCHNDTENAVAGSLAAVRAGARLVQGTLNGLGERCGNANLISIIPSIMLKMGLPTNIPAHALPSLTHVSRLLEERLNRNPNRHAAYVGEAAFAHKGGLHVSAVARDPRSYEHIDPATVGNRRHILVSDQSGRANVLSRLNEVGLTISADHPKLAVLLDLVKQREFAGFAYDGASASFELLAMRELGGLPDFFTLSSFRVLDEQRWNALGAVEVLSEATVKGTIKGEESMTVAEGNGPINALDNALRKWLVPHYPVLATVQLLDYKVRILTSADGTGALTRVLIESRDVLGLEWATVGVSTNVIDASFQALQEAILWRLLPHRIKM